MIKHKRFMVLSLYLIAFFCLSINPAFCQAGGVNDLDISLQEIEGKIKQEQEAINGLKKKQSAILKKKKEIQKSLQQKKEAKPEGAAVVINVPVTQAPEIMQQKSAEIKIARGPSGNETLPQAEKEISGEAAGDLNAWLVKKKEIAREEERQQREAAQQKLKEAAASEEKAKIREAKRLALAERKREVVEQKEERRRKDAIKEEAAKYKREESLQGENKKQIAPKQPAGEQKRQAGIKSWLNKLEEMDAYLRKVLW